MKIFGVLLATLVAGSVAMAQTSSTNAAAQAGEGNSLAFTNNTGQRFSVDDLATQLRNLRGSIERTLPMLSAFNQNYSNSTPGTATQTVENRVSSYVSGFLNKRSNQTAAGATNGTGTEVVSNLVARLGGAFGGNTGGSAPVDASTLQRLTELQQQLQALSPTLAALNISTNTGGAGAATGGSANFGTGTGTGQSRNSQ
jgi:hypothetical protein